MSDQSTLVDHPAAPVPASLFADAAAEARWRARFHSVRIGLPHPARDNPGRAVFVSNLSGSYEVHTWDVASGDQIQATDRPDGTVHAGLTPDGGHLWWFDDTDGDEFGVWRRQRFGTTGPAEPALPGTAPGYSAGLELGADVVLAGFSDDDGTRIHLSRAGSDTVVYRHSEPAAVEALSADDSVWVLSHSEAGDSRYPDLRAFAVADGTVLGELSDGDGKALNGLAFPPVHGDQRLLVGHERRGRDELLIWNVATGEVTELDIDLPGDLDGDFYPDGDALLILHTYHGRTGLHRYDLTTGTLTTLPASRGTVSAALARPDGAVWYRHSSASSAPSVRVLNGTDRPLVQPPGGAAPGSEPLDDVWVDGPGGPIHAFLSRPVENMTPGPTVFYLHGGPAAQDDDSFDATRAAWLDAGVTVVQVNYRGSTGYGSAWRDALTERIGHTELADVHAVHDHLVAARAIDPDRCVLLGYSWGGYLALLALGVSPQRWAAAVAGVPIADYVAAYEDEMEPLRAYDRALFGGSPDQVPDRYRDASPLTWVDSVRAPVLISAGENDPRTPIRQVENYLDALRRRGHRYEVYRYDAGHGSMVVEERIRQVLVEIGFVRRVLDERD